jgi:hypothetical protein
VSQFAVFLRRPKNQWPNRLPSPNLPVRRVMLAFSLSKNCDRE